MTEIISATEYVQAWLAEYDAAFAAASPESAPDNPDGTRPVFCGDGAHQVRANARLYAYAPCAEGHEVPVGTRNYLTIDHIRYAVLAASNSIAAPFAAGIGFPRTAADHTIAADDPRLIKNPVDTAQVCRDAYAAMLAARTALADAERAHFQATTGGRT